MNETETQDYRSFLAKRRAAILRRIASAAAKSGRSAGDVTLLAVSKTVDVDAVVLAHAVGYDVFGENRPQELKRKVAAARELEALADVRFDMIGNLQTNKINQVLSTATLVHSVSSTHLAQAIASRSVVRGRTTPCLLEVNVSGEVSKSGFSPQEVRVAVESLMELEGIALEGLMTMAPAGDADAARRTFSGLREVADELRAQTGLALETLSCGMSGDFEAAVEEGSTLVRLGRIVFDPAYACV